ncbi:MAG: 50S ribosomal protein L4 [Patescibacteria group bacterium]
MTKTTQEKKTKKVVDFNAPILSKEGKAAGTIALPESCFGLSWNGDLVHQVITSLQTSARHPFAHVRTRGEVSGGGKKPWRQKGTGRARHGSSRSPIWVGGGVAHGPRNDKNFDRKVNKKAKDKAIATILSKKFSDSEIIFLDTLAITTPKTTEIKSLIANLAGANDSFTTLASKKHNAALIVTPSHDMNTILSARNFKNIEVQTVSSINPLIVSKYKYIVFVSPKESIDSLVERFNKA